MILPGFPRPMPMAGGLPSIGDPYEGGFFAGQIEYGGTLYNLVVAPKSGGETPGNVQWKTSRSATTGTGSDSDGWANTNAMNDASHPAAQFCRSLTIGGFSDWYLPAKNELEILYFNLKPTTESNSTDSGINPNAVPPRASNYTSSVPSQSPVAAFQSGGSEAFGGGEMWSSTEYTSLTTTAWIQRLPTNGRQTQNFKDTTFTRARAVRRVPA